MKIAQLFTALMLLISVCAHADMALLYTRSTIAIERQHPPVPPPMPWGAAASSEEPAVTFDTEIRDAAALYHQNGWYSLSSPEEGSAVLLVFDKPGISPIKKSTQYAPLDILLIDAQGKITQIVPDIILAGIDHDIVPAAPVLAFLLLKGGTCEKRSIQPGDTVQYSIFKKSPTVLGTTPAAPEPKTAPMMIETPPQ